MKLHFDEIPNTFYLGAMVNPETGQVIEDAPIYYDARDLTTHGVIVGMTGSGKTGLGVTILEEAILDNIPTIIIDPKGDITNLLLAFPQLTPENFRPWVNPEDATRSDRSLEEQAKFEADRWQKGIEEWGLTNDRIQDYRKSARFSIYTPGSEAGLPISILQSFAAPSEGWAGNEETLRDRISGTVSALLSLIGINAQPVEDREHILLSNIFEYNWRNGIDLTMEQLILQVQTPPFAKLGVFEVDTLFAQKDRFKLAQKLNNILATPSFQNWIKGEALHIPSMLYTPEGNPRATIFYIAHLNDQERNFIITLILQGILSWMRTLSGSTSLRALIYMDELFGLFPPYPRNPVTKEPILRLLKQGRAFGIGMLIATQNPVDLDYKGLSNAGTWWIGKLQTENDKNRVLEGLDSARDATSALDIKTVATELGRLQQRQFVMHNIHEPVTPILIQSRWSMSFLRGPLTRDEIARLMASQKAAAPQPEESLPSYLTPAPAVHQQTASQRDQGVFSSPASGAPAYSGTPEPPSNAMVVAPAETRAPVEAEQIPPGFAPIPPALPMSIGQYFIPIELPVEQAIRGWERWTGQSALNVKTNKRLLYRPALLAQAQVRFAHTQSASSEILWYGFVVPNLPRVAFLNWSKYQAEPFDPNALEPHAFSGRTFYGEVPQTLTTNNAFKELQANLLDWLYNNARLNVYYNSTLKLYSMLNESKRDFMTRVVADAREARDAELDATAMKYDKKLQALEDRAQQKAARLGLIRDDSDARKREELLSGGESLYRMMQGSFYNTFSRAGRLRRMTAFSERHVGVLQQELLDLADKLEAAEADMKDALTKVKEKWDRSTRQIQEIPVTPYKKDMSMILFGVGWVPYWDMLINGQPVILPASSSGLSLAQDPSLTKGGSGARYY